MFAEREQQHLIAFKPLQSRTDHINTQSLKLCFSVFLAFEIPSCTDLLGMVSCFRMIGSVEVIMREADKFFPKM